MNFERFYDVRLLLALSLLGLVLLFSFSVIEGFKVTPADVEAVASEFLVERGKNFSNLSCKSSGKMKGYWSCIGGGCVPIYHADDAPIGYWRCNYSDAGTTNEIFCAAAFPLKGCLAKTRQS